MAARAQAGRTAARRPQRRPAPRRRPGARSAGSRIHWDRVGRVALTLVLAAVLYSYFNPAINLVKTYTATTDAKVKLHELLRENRHLHNRVQEADNPIVIDAKARAQGMVSPEQTPVVIHGLGS